MQIKQVYEKYQIMLQLSLHMRRVAGVGKLILDGWKEEIDRDLVMRTLLLHDMGNIVKFDLSAEGQKKFMSTASGNLESWRELQREYWAKYGKDTHEVTRQIVAELGQDDVNLVMEQDHTTYHSGDRMRILDQPWPAQILQYADTRVTPNGVTSLETRIEDLCHRYSQPLQNFAYMYALEKAIQGMTTIDLQTINEKAVEPFLDEFLEYSI